MEKVTLKAEPRKALGTKATRSLRATGRLPAVVYGHGEPPEAISFEHHEVELALAHGARTLEVTLGDATKPYLIKEVQYDHFAHEPIHMDLARVDLHERVKVRVGIEPRGVPKGVSEGGALEQYMAYLDIECLVTEIPGILHPLVTGLGLGDSLFVKDLQLPPGVRALANPEDRVATVRALAEAPVEAVAAAEEVTAEPEVIGRVRKEEEAEGEA